MTAPIVISIIALVISCITLLWNVYQYYDKLKVKIRIDMKFRTLPDSRDIIGYGYVVTNISQIPINVSNYEYYMDGLHNQQVVFAQHLVKTPIKLESGSVQEFWLPAKDLVQAMKERNSTKLQFLVKDTFGKTVKTDWHTIIKS